MTGMVQVGDLVRDLAASAAMAVEDELDWEHLPHVHASTFRAAALVRADRDGWEADVELQDGARMRMKVTLDPDRLGYTNATFSDGRENGRAVARLVDTGPDRCRMHLRFYVPDAPQPDLAAAGAFYSAVFGRIIDEDEPKMIHRAAFLKIGPAALRLRRTLRLADGATVEAPRLCPHQGLPLDGEPDDDGVITCPWHGYRFDARTGACLSGQIRGWGPRGGAAG
jgi:hypothetical protein